MRLLPSVVEILSMPTRHKNRMVILFMAIWIGKSVCKKKRNASIIKIYPSIFIRKLRT